MGRRRGRGRGGMSLFICICAAVFGLIWAARHPCKSMLGVWARRGLGILCFALALVPIFFLAGTAGVRQETPYEFELESMEQAYAAREFLEEEADYYSLESTMRSSGLWDGTYGRYWEILHGAQLNAQRCRLLEAAAADTSGQSEYAALAQQAGEELRRLAEETEYEENRALLEKWAN